MERLADHLTRALLAVLVVGALLGMLEATLRVEAGGTGLCLRANAATSTAET